MLLFLTLLRDQNFFLHNFSSWVELRLTSESHLPGLPASTLKVCGGGVGGWVGEKVIMWSIQLKLSWAVTIYPPTEEGQACTDWRVRTPIFCVTYFFTEGVILGF